MSRSSDLASPREEAGRRAAPDLLACYYTMAGPYGWATGGKSPWPLRARIEAAARAGYRGIGLAHSDLGEATSGALREIASILDDSGIVHVELEMLLDWYVDGEARAASDAIRRTLLTAAEALGAARIKAAGQLLSSEPPPIDSMTHTFAELARQAHDAGTTIALEPIPFSNVSSLELAIAIVGDTPGRGGGLLIDSWHVARGGYSLDRLAALPSGVIAGVELNDGAARAQPDPLAEALNEHLLCGHGAFGLRPLIAAVRAAGYAGPWGVEILSEAQRALDIDAAAQRSFDTTIALFDTPAA